MIYHKRATKLPKARLRETLHPSAVPLLPGRTAGRHPGHPGHPLTPSHPPAVGARFWTEKEEVDHPDKRILGCSMR